MSATHANVGRRSTIRLLLSAHQRKEALAWLKGLRAAGLKISHHLALSIDEFGLRLMTHRCDVIVTCRQHQGRVGRLEMDALTLLDHDVPVVAVLPSEQDPAAPVLAASGVADSVSAGRPDLLAAVVRRLAVERDLRAEQSRRAQAHQDRVRLAALSRDIGSALTREENLTTSLSGCVEALVKHLDASLARIWWFDPDNQALEMRASAGLLEPGASTFERIPVGRFGVGHVAAERRAYLTNQVMGDAYVGAQPWLQANGIVSFAGYPLMVGETLVGVVAMFSRVALSGFTINALAAAADEMALGLGRRRTELALEDAEARFRLLAENLPGVFWLADPQRRRFSYVSSGFASVFGQPAEVLYENGQYWPMALHPEDRNRFQAALESDWIATGAFEVEYRIARPDGGQRWVRDRAFPIRDPDGQVRRVAGITEDITSHKQLETQFLQAQKMQSIGRLAGGVAHDFNNLLTAIGSFARMAFDALPEDSYARSDLEQVLQATQRAVNLTRQLLAFARLQPVEQVVMSPNDRLVSLTKMLSRLVREDAELVVRPGAGVGHVRVDPAQFEQMLVNLVVNAVHAVKANGMIVIETADVQIGPESRLRMLGLAPGPFVVISVSDNGCGMSEEVQSHLFEPFFTTKGRGQGTGLGLATVYSIVKQSSGHIEVQSEVGKGTKVSVYLPRLDEPVEVAPEMPLMCRTTGGREVVLVVEDEPKVRDVVLRVLGMCGYTVLETFNGEQALEQIRADQEERIQLVVTDLIMPKMGGRELAAELRQWRPGLRVLFMSGYADELYGEKSCLEAGVPFVQKPFTPEQLLTKVRAALDAPAPGIIT